MEVLRQRNMRRPALEDSNHDEHVSMLPNDGEHSSQSNSIRVKRISSPGSKGNNLNFLRIPWAIELSACVFSVACMASVVLVLVLENGKSIDNWKLAIPVNAVVSFLATMAKSSFLLTLTEIISQLKWGHFRRSTQPLEDFELFDSASRGPLGSLLILRKHKDAVRASCAAFLVLAALLVDPFVQLSIRFPSKPFPETQNVTAATFRTTTAYNPSAIPYTGTDNWSQAAFSATRLQAAISAAIYTKDVVHELSCSTGNCTFTNLSTLGVCGSCSNITTAIKTSCGSECYYQMPSGSILMGYTISSPEGGRGITVWNSSAAGNFTNLDPTLNDGTNIMSFEAIQVPKFESFPPKTLNAWRGSLFWCGLTYETVNVTLGNISFSEPTKTYLQTRPPVDDGTANPANGPNLQWYLEFDPKPNVSGVFPRVLQVNIQDHRSAGRYLSELFSTGWNTLGYATEAPRSGYDGQRTAPLVRSAPSAGQQLAEEFDMQTLMARLAESMTEAVRTSQTMNTDSSERSDMLSAFSVYEKGTAFTWKTYVKVRWAWLALPITLITLSCVLLAIIVFKTRKERHLLWKSSAVAVLFHQLKGWDEEDLRISGPTDLFEKSKAMRGQLETFEGIQILKADGQQVP
ncbi:hypothetical protein CBER1_10676 [Cercospora berteroae]|uniref:Uncharacterized protein n=1 Tax=Cercospora berteroae TaxID=357750 RepID=A0A2S6BYS2_9PEZI|nr:hypothetical protein CBER1_10676 [Cercospora berteroae]